MHTAHAVWLLRIGVALAFIYPPISAYFTPHAWVGYFPGFLSALPISEITLLHLFGALEILLALWILSGKKTVVSNVLAAVVLFAIVAVNFSQLDVLFRDVSIALAALALAFMEHQRENRRGVPSE